ncbi:MAG TPA: NYN domain-containing protein [Nitrolancea sp.]|nr:NYN domain-containing protein [Nitrolancea sp.]
MRVNVYVDGFNLYFGIKHYDSQGKNYRWLNLHRLSVLLLPGHEIGRIRYFTAQVDGREDVYSPARQQVFWNALQTLPSISIHKGQFLSSTVRMRLVAAPPSGPKTVEVWKTEEKGSDVNIATYLLLDCFHKDFELAVIISNDSDLIEPIRVVREEFGCIVWVFNPQQRFSRALWRTANRYTKIEEHHLADAQFPQTIEHGSSRITCPGKWRDVASLE